MEGGLTYCQSSVPGSGSASTNAGVLLFHRVILEEVAVAGLASSVFDSDSSRLHLPKSHSPFRRVVQVHGFVDCVRWPAAFPLEFYHKTNHQFPTYSFSSKSSVSSRVWVRVSSFSLIHHTGHPRKQPLADQTRNGSTRNIEEPVDAL